MDWMTLSGYRLPPQVSGGGLPQQQQQQQQQQHQHHPHQQHQQQQHDVSKLIVGDNGIPSPGLGGSVTGSLSLSPGLNLGPCSTGSSSASSSPTMMNMWTNSIKVEASSGPAGNSSALSPPGVGGAGVSSPGSIKGQHKTRKHKITFAVLVEI